LTEPSPPPIRVAARAARRVARAGALALVLAAATVASAVAGLQSPGARRVLLARLNERVLAPAFQGKLTVLSVGRLGPFGVTGVSARLDDADGRPLLLVDGVDARVATLTLLRSLALGHGEVVLDLSEVTIHNVDVRLDADGDGLAIARALRPKSPASASPSPAPPRAVRIYAPHVRLDHAWAHGVMRGLPYLDVDLGGLDAALALTPTLLALDARRGAVVARGLAAGANVAGSFHGHLDLVPAPVPVVTGRFGWDGAVGLLHETLSAALEMGHVDATLDVHDATPEALRSVWPASPVTATGTAHLEAHGPLEAVDLAVHAGLDSATLDVQGTLGWGATRTAKLHLDAAGIDANQFASAAFASSLGVKADVRLAVSGDGRLDGVADVDVAGGHVGPHAIPHATLHTSGFRIPSGPFGGDGTLVIDEPGAPTTLTLHAVPHGQTSSVDFTILSHDVRLGALRRLSTEASGNLHIQGKGTVDLDSLEVELAVDSHGKTLKQGSVHAGSVELQAHSRGSLPNPTVDVTLHARDLGWDATTLSALDVTVRGRALTPHVTIHERSPDLPDLDAELDLDVLDGPSARHADLHVAHAGESAHVQVGHARFTHGDIAVDDAVVEGLGAPATLSFSRVGTTLHLHAKAPNVEVTRVARLLDLERTIHGGSLDLDADVSIGPRRAGGRVAGRLEHTTVGPLEDVSGRLDGRLEDRRFVGTASVRAGGLGTLDVDARQLAMGGQTPLLATSWQKAWGAIGLKGHVDLAKLAALAPKGPVAPPEVQGTLDLVGRLERDSQSDFTPLLELDLATSNLLLRAPPEGPGPVASPGPARRKPWTLEGVDANTSVRINGDTGFLALEAHVHDAKGDLAEIEASSAAIPYEAIYAAPREAGRKVPDIPFDVHVKVPSRGLKSWPASLGRSPVDGDLQADLVLEGPLSAPRLLATASLAHVTTAFARLTSPVELALRAAYDGSHADLELRGHHNAREVLTAEAHGLVQAADLLAGAAHLPWRASGKAHVEALPLIVFGPLDDRQVRGRLTGDLRVDDLNADAKGVASFSVASLKVGDASYPATKASLRADGKTVEAEVRLDQDDGFGSVNATVVAPWGASLAPVPDPSKVASVTLKAKHFRAAVLRPFVQGAVDEIDGLLDADAQVTVEPKSLEAHVEGSATLTDGLFELGAFGGEFHDVSGKLTVTKEGLLTVEKFSAYGLSGALLGSASAHLDGLRMQTAAATLRVPKSHPLPLSARGAPLGMIDGTLNLSESLSADRKQLDVTVDVPTMHLVATEAKGQDVQDLGKLQGVTLGTRATPGASFVQDPTDVDDTEEGANVRSTDAVQVHVTTHLGDDVTLRRGSALRVQLTGGPSVTVAEKTRVTGQVQLRNGVLVLYGKNFEIEHGTVTFVGDDPSNPQAAVTAGWTAGDGTQVKADFIGPLRTGKVTLRSEPPLSQNDIVQLLLFGTADGASSAAQPAPGSNGAEGVAGNLAGNAATAPLNRALDQFGLSAVSAKVDTTTVVARPEVTVQIARDVSVQLAHLLFIGPPPPGTSPDTTLLTIDWRFLRKWSVEATVGNAGSTIVDMVWQYRY